MEHNCFRLDYDGTPIKGIPLARNKRVIGLQYERDDVTVTIPFAIRDNQHPRTKQRMLYEGLPRVNESTQQRYILPRGTWDGALLLVETRNLTFSDDAIATALDVANAWAGAEALTPAFLQLGRRTDTDQIQLVAIEKGAGVFIADQQARYVHVHNTGERLVNRDVRVEDFAWYLARRAEVHPRKTHAMLTWTFKTLERLGMLKFWTQSLATAFARLSVARQEERRRVRA